jgi:phosphoribosyl-AMP cyclohydrolase
MGGLLPVIVQDINNKSVLMQAYANQEAFDLTIKTGYAHYYSRSRNKIWKKGESSGNTQKIFKIYSDCDGDCLLYVVTQRGVACHTGAESCFFNILYENDKEYRLD